MQSSTPTRFKALAIMAMVGLGFFVGAFGPLSLSGCAVERPALSSDLLTARKAEQLALLAKYRKGVDERLARRMAREVMGAKPGEEPIVEILVISGGGDYGAFGAGFLQGWGWNVTPTDGTILYRPQFDVVSGVSTGALIAPFAFVGTDPQYTRITNMYSAPKQKWFVSRGLLKLLFGAESYMETKGLREDLELQVDSKVIDAIAAGEREDRTLWIGTTNLDLGVMYPWDLTLEARRIVDAPEDVAKGNEGEKAPKPKVGVDGASVKRLHDILMASAAIPAIFPPVVIDNTLYVDGGTTSNILFDADLCRTGGPVELFRAAHPDLKPPKFRYWVIINNKLGADERVVQPTWLSITKASVATAIRSSTISSLKLLEAQAALQRTYGLSVEFRFVAIPEDWRPPADNLEPFDERLMRSLLETGRRMGERPDSWRATVPDW